MGTYSRLHVPIVTLDDCLGLFMLFSVLICFFCFFVVLCSQHFSNCSRAQKQHMCYHDVSHCFAKVWSMTHPSKTVDKTHRISGWGLSEIVGA